MVHRDDTVDAILSIASNWDLTDKQYINCGGPDVISRQQFTEIVKRVALPTLKFKVTLSHYVLNSEKAIKAFLRMLRNDV